MTFTTSKAVGDRISIFALPSESTTSPIWLDVNNNRVMDTGEEIRNLVGRTTFTIQHQTMTLYGDVGRFECRSCNLTALNVSMNPSLTYLKCYGNQLSSLILGNNALTEISCSSNKLTTLDLSAVPNLVTLNVGYNLLTSMNLSNLSHLETLYCNSNQLPILDLDDCTSLVELHCYYNQITALDLSHCLNLVTLNCFSNKLTALNITDNTALVTVSCYRNEINLMDVSQNTALKVFNCSSNHLSSVDISSNLALATFNCSSNNLTAVDVSANLALKVFDCFRNTLSNLDVTHNPHLTKIGCAYCSLDSLDVTQNTALQQFYCQSNNFKKIDVSKNLNLTNFYCNENSIDSLDVSLNTALTTLYCDNNLLETLDVTTNINLYSLNCYDNQLDSLDVTQNSKLKYLKCFDNQIRFLNLNNNIELVYLYCYENQLDSLDVTQNSKLTRLYCYENQLKMVNVANGNNLIFNNKYNYVQFHNNPDLECIQIDPGFTPNSQWRKDVTANYSSVVCPEYIPFCTLEIDDSPWCHISTSKDSKRKNKASHIDTIRIKRATHIKEKLSVITTDFPANLFELIAVTQDENGHDCFLPTCSATNDSVEFEMPETKVRLTTKLNVQENAESAIPNQAYYLELHEGSSLSNRPVSGATQVDNMIMYKRTFVPNQWYAISFPFTISRVTVIDEGIEYELAACSSSQNSDGNFYLKGITNAVGHDDVQRSWDWETTIAKNKSYIIAFPSTYYSGKEIIFYGEAQTINDASNQFSTTSNANANNYTYKCNTSFNDQTVQDPYLLSADGTYFEKHTGPYTLKPFMSYVYSVTAPSMAPMHLSFEDILGPKKDPTDVDNTLLNATLDYHIKGHQLIVQSNSSETLRVVTMDGKFVTSIQLYPSVEQAITLETGAYLLKFSSDSVVKIVI